MNKRLRKLAFKSLIVGCKVAKEENKKREKLFSAVLKWANDVTKKTMLKVFREATVR